MSEEIERRARVFDEMRPRLFGIAYRMLGIRADAEDVLQDAWLRYRGVTEVRSDEGLLVQTTTRLCLDRSKSARRQRERYVGLWLPEPLSDEVLPDAEMEHLESLTMAMLHVIDRLEPMERAVFLLREAFHYPYQRIGELVGRRPEACRQIAHRARKRVREDPVGSLDPREHEDLLRAFLDAAQRGDVEALEAHLTEKAALIADGGGKAVTARNAVVGRTRVARFFAGVAQSMDDGTGVVIRRLNGLPAAVVVDDGAVIATFSLDVVDGSIRRVFSVRNPDKLRSVAAIA